MTRDQRLAAEMARKHGTLYESATDRAARKKSASRSEIHPDAWAGAAEYVRSSPQSAKRRASHRANVRDEPEKSILRSITAWYRSQ